MGMEDTAFDENPAGHFLETEEECILTKIYDARIIKYKDWFSV